MKFFGRAYPTSQIVFLRYVFATASLLPVVSRAKKGEAALWRISKLHFIRAALLLLAMTLYCWALHRLPIATAVALNFIIPIFTLIFTRIFLKEKITGGSIIATMVGAVGVLVVFEPGNAKFTAFAAAMVLLSAALFASLDVINKKFVGGEGVFRMVLHTATITSLLSCPFALWKWVWPSMGDLCLFAALGCGANLLLYCTLRAFEKVDMSAIVPLRYFEFVLTAVAGFAIFGEIPSVSTILGALLIISSTVYAVLAGVKK
jgi:drug/metabolite transporter (DMT)-like permease